MCMQNIETGSDYYYSILFVVFVSKWNVFYEHTKHSSKNEINNIFLSYKIDVKRPIIFKFYYFDTKKLNFKVQVWLF